MNQRAMSNLDNVRVFAFDLYDTTVEETVHNNPYNKLHKFSGKDKKEFKDFALTTNTSVEELFKLFNIDDQTFIQKILQDLEDEYHGTILKP